MSKLITTLIVGILFLSAAHSYGQTTSAKKKSTIGFYGKRFVMQFGGGIHHNTLLKFASSYERDMRNSTYYEKYRSETKSDQFNYSVYGNLGVVIGKRTTFSVDFNYYFGNMVLRGYGGKEFYDNLGNYTSIAGIDGRISYNTIRIMPRIEIGSRSSSAPVGLVNVLGIGVEMSKAKSGRYIMVDPQYISAIGNPYEKNMTFVDEFAFNLTVQYGLEYRLPITKNIAWNFGGYLHLNLPISVIANEFIGLDFGDYDPYGNKNWDREMKDRLSLTRLQNLFSLRTGLVIML
ncbi:hypothetical protein [Fluviicola taffensis]|uniref:Outer membrane protein beta-barrel domain-containing protein n=1 Tax=Fluviicola taffensis (strain DSM 16823 / NCIMB 13979 / RW262) TaxID=755732 RepID=F2IIE2_FLUTR|nr:hypothetical protein [Fluviicola taffensis]AEA44868.1 hypothetical protein Fluta_2889 [Fluviicola taffensis DSM 16823]